jgi:hypothetical protein
LVVFESAWRRTLSETGLFDDLRVREASKRTQPLQWILDEGGVAAEPLLRAVSGALGIGYTTFETDRGDGSLVRELGGGERWGPRHLIPLQSTEPALRVAIANPMDLAALDEIALASGRRVEPVLALPSDIEREYRRMGPRRLPEGLRVCPQCEGDLVPILYGYPGQEMLEAAQRGEIVLGGCMVGEDDPQYRCGRCGRTWL